MTMGKLIFLPPLLCPPLLQTFLLPPRAFPNFFRSGEGKKSDWHKKTFRGKGGGARRGHFSRFVC